MTLPNHSPPRRYLLIGALLLLLAIGAGFAARYFYTESVGRFYRDNKIVVLSIQNHDVSRKLIEGMRKMAESEYPTLKSDYKALSTAFASQQFKFRLPLAASILGFLSAAYYLVQALRGRRQA